MTAQPVQVSHHLARVVTPKPSEIKKATNEVEGLYAKPPLPHPPGGGTRGCAPLSCPPPHHPPPEGKRGGAPPPSSGRPAPPPPPPPPAYH